MGGAVDARAARARAHLLGPRGRRAAAGREPAGMGVVFLHGKGVWPGAFDGGIPGALEAEGRQVVSPEMPWSLRRMYGATFEQAMTEIDAAVAGLKAKGATRIVVIGHSLGANAAIGYAARRSRGRRGGRDRARPPAGDRGNARPHPRRAGRGAADVCGRRAGQAHLARHGAGHPDLRFGDAGGLSQHVRSGRAGGDPQEHRVVAAFRSCGWSATATRSMSAAATMRLRAAPRIRRAAMSRSRPAISPRSLGGALAGRRMVEERCRCAARRREGEWSMSSDDDRSDDGRSDDPDVQEFMDEVEQHSRPSTSWCPTTWTISKSPRRSFPTFCSTSPSTCAWSPMSSTRKSLRPAGSSSTSTACATRSSRSARVQEGRRGLHQVGKDRHRRGRKEAEEESATDE